MTKHNRMGLTASLFALVGIPVIFLIISLYTGDWGFFLLSLPAAFVAGLSGLITTIQQIKKDKSDGTES
ncbi:hypothetical protein GCM10028778_16280 [Barrientosiimonas marina]|uniref:Uncharacterized protein n=1 Tax=Lentibacillus kimchii TaxID=1542911 RepID=A0ABW2UV84_9BACI